MSDSVLFWQHDLGSIVANHRNLSLKLVGEFNETRLLNTPTVDIVDPILAEYELKVPVLELEGIVVSHRQAQRERFDYGRQISITGTEITFEIPFEGDPDFFRTRPNTFDTNPPHASVGSKTIWFSIMTYDQDREKLLAEQKATVAAIEKYLTWLRQVAEPFNLELATVVERAVEERKAKVLATHNLIADLGFPLAKRAGVSPTYLAPIRRKSIVSPKPAPATPYRPEPALQEEHYKDILRAIESMTAVMERSPAAFLSMSEESIRQHFLVTLNATYEGSATGETFNFKGKTDILIREQDRNIFIAECKFWKGQKSFADAVDQVLGYLGWRDTKAALLVFNRGQKLTDVIEKAKNAMSDHQHTKKGPTQEGETRFRYIMRNPGDEHREIILTVMIFDVPHA